MANSNAASVPISIPMVTIPAGLHLLMKDLNTAEAANVEKAVDAVYKKCSEHSNADLVTVRKAFIDSGTLGTYVKIGKRCMDNVKIQTTMAATVRLLIAPPAKGKVSISIIVSAFIPPRNGKTSRGPWGFHSSNAFSTFYFTFRFLFVSLLS